jgi:hypothetical protein
MTAREDHRRPTGADLPADQLRLGDLGDGCVDAIALPSGTIMRSRRLWR